MNQTIAVIVYAIGWVMANVAFCRVVPVEGALMLSNGVGTMGLAFLLANTH